MKKDTCPFNIIVIENKQNLSRYKDVLALIKQNNFNIQEIQSDNFSELSTTYQLTFNSKKFLVEGDPTKIPHLNDVLKTFAFYSHIDIGIFDSSFFQKKYCLAALDMDSTIIDMEIINKVAEYAGVGDKIKKITAETMGGIGDFAESFKLRLAQLKGVDESVLKKIALSLPPAKGLDSLLPILAQKGCKLALITGGFTYFSSFVKEKYGFDYAYGNEIEIIGGKMTGYHKGEIVDGRKKADLLIDIAIKENIDLSNTLSVGDGSNDVLMLQSAGLGISFHASDAVSKKVPFNINYTNIDAILAFLLQ